MFGNKGWEVAGGGGSGASSFFINVLWKELKELRDSAKLIPGMSYRITDYVATTSDPESRSANHPFDIIVTADDEHTLNENARAIAHEGDTYFNECNLAAWKLKYCLDNDTQRFSWAQKGGEYFNAVCSALGLNSEMVYDGDNDTTIEGYSHRFNISVSGYDIVFLAPAKEFATTTLCYIYYGDEEPTQVSVDSITRVVYEDGKGVVYHLTDEHRNSISFDFKGILIALYRAFIDNISFYTTYKGFDSIEFVGYCYLLTQLDENFDNSVKDSYGIAENNKFQSSNEGELLHAICALKEIPIKNCLNLCGNYWVADYSCQQFICFDENSNWYSNGKFVAEKSFARVINKTGFIGPVKFLGDCYNFICDCPNSIIIGEMKFSSSSGIGQVSASNALVSKDEDTLLIKQISDLLL